MRLVVTDTGPVLHLHEAGALHLLQLAGKVLVPPAVEGELSRLVPPWPANRPSWLVRVELGEAAQNEARSWLEGNLLDPGEAEALSLAKQLDADRLVTDDTAARVIAAPLGLEVHGSLGVVLWAAAIGKLDRDEARQSLDRLFRSSLWASPRVRAEAFSALKSLFDE